MPSRSAVAAIVTENNFFRVHAEKTVLAAAVLAGVIVISRGNYLLVHTLVEFFSIVVACGIFMFTWNTRAMTGGRIQLLGIAYLFVAGLDLMHALTFEGMGVFGRLSPNASTQLWIAARYVESVSLLLVPLIDDRSRLNIRVLFPIYTVVFAAVLATVLVWPVFPNAYLPESGLTPFKIASEWVIAGLLVAGIALLRRRKRLFEPAVQRLLIASMVFTIASDLVLTLYVSVSGPYNLTGHLFKLVSFYLIYKAIISTGLQRPFDLLFREIKQSEARLRRSEARYRNLATLLPTGICQIRPTRRIAYMNSAGLGIIGYSQEDLHNGIDIDDLVHPDSGRESLNRLKRALSGEKQECVEYRFIRKTGEPVTVLISSAPVLRQGRLTYIQTSITDITELKRFQTQCQNASKMEAIATLAGGIAHEVNNALMGIVGHIDLLELKSIDEKVGPRDLTALSQGCDRIAMLTKQLLAYSRGGRYRTDLIQLGRFVQETLKKKEPWLIAPVRLAIDPGARQSAVQADATQMQMVLTAVLANASEAIQAGGGLITVSIRNHDVEARTPECPGLAPGRYIFLEVLDNGIGMDEKTRARIFEPFFTTKFQGRGLGMAAVFGIIKNHGGWIDVKSQPQAGTRVQIYLPRQDETTGVDAADREAGPGFLRPVESDGLRVAHTDDFMEHPSQRQSA